MRYKGLGIFFVLLLMSFALCGSVLGLSTDIYQSVSDYTYANTVPNGHNANNIVVYLPGLGETTLQKALLQNTSGPVRQVGSNLYLNTTGNVGIGTTNPGAKFDVVDSASAPATGTAIVESSGGNANFVIKAASTASYAYQTFFQGSTGQFEIGIVPTTADFYMNTNVQSGSSGSSVFIKKSNGFIGINTTSPSAMMDVNGNLYVRSSLSTSNIFSYSGNIAIDSGSSSNAVLFKIGGGEKARVDTTGNFGIGTTSPGQKLSVAGTVESTSGGFKFPDGTVQSTAAASTSANTTSTVSSGYLPKATGSSALGNSVVYDAGGYVGIGTASPANYVLNVNGRAAASSVAVASTYTDLTNNAPWYGLGYSNLNPQSLAGTAVQVAGYYGLNLQTGTGQIYIRGDSSGQVGIGTTAPSYKLDVNGNGNFASNLNVGGDTTHSGWIYVPNNKGIISSGSNTILLGDDDNLNLSNGKAYLQYSTGNLGIGTQSPSQKLEVAGTIYSNSGGFKFPDGTVQTTAAASTSANTTSTVTTNYVPKATGSSALGNSLIYDSGSAVGIGTSSPSTKAHVYGTLTVDAAGQALNSYSEGIRLGAASNGYSIITFGANPSSASGTQANQWWIGKHGGDNGFNIWGNSPGDAFHILPSGNVGIGTITPGQKLSVAGTIESTSGGFKFPDGTTQTTAAASTSANISGIMSAGYIQKATSGTALGNSVLYETGGKIGVGTTSPLSAVDVNGNVNATYFYTRGSGSTYITADGTSGIAVGGGYLYANGASNSLYVQNTANFRGNIYNDAAAYLTVTGGTSGYTYFPNTIGIGTTKPGYALDAPVGTLNASIMRATSFVYSSDARLKKNIQPLNGPSALSAVLALNPVTFQWKDGIGDNQTHYGLIAQDVQAALPDAVSTGQNGYLAVEYGNLVAPLTAAIKEQQKTIEAQQQQIDQLRADVEALKARN